VRVRPAGTAAAERFAAAAGLRLHHTVRTFNPSAHRLENPMLYYAVIFFVIALIAALFGFTGIAAGAAGVAKVLFFVFIVLAIVSFLVNVFRGRT
jgi:uncharacterized membrane protein YtjA (UPF0391 family)